MCAVHQCTPVCTPMQFTYMLHLELVERSYRHDLLHMELGGNSTTYNLQAGGQEFEPPHLHQ